MPRLTRYPPEERTEKMKRIAAAVKSGYPLTKACKEFGTTAVSYHNWKSRFCQECFAWFPNKKHRVEHELMTHSKGLL